MTSREKKLQSVIETVKKLSTIQDVDVLLERLLTEARAIVHADAGSIYVLDGNSIRIRYAQNDTQLAKLAPGDKLPYVSFSFPVTEKSVVGASVLSGSPINIADCYNLPAGVPYAFNKMTDITTGYRTKSMLTLPLKMANGRILGVLQIINAQDGEGNVIGFDDDAVLYITHFASNAAQALEHAYLTRNMIKRMQRMAAYRDPKETYPHVERVASFAVEIYDRWALSHNVPESEQQSYRDNLRIAAKCHDFGKVGVSDVILKKVSPRFTPEERSIMKGHTCIGAMLFEEPESTLDIMAKDVCLYHHEWWDGSASGYPGSFDYNKYIIGEPLPESRPLKGEEIPLAARIVALADVFDALSHKRVYKEAWSVDDAFGEIASLSGTQFDPELVAAFLQIKERICAINTAWETVAED